MCLAIHLKCAYLAIYKENLTCIRYIPTYLLLLTLPVMFKVTIKIDLMVKLRTVHSVYL